MGTEGKRDILDWLTEVVDEVVKRYCEGVDVVVVRRDGERVEGCVDTVIARRVQDGGDS